MNLCTLDKIPDLILCRQNVRSTGQRKVILKIMGQYPSHV